MKSIMIASLLMIAAVAGGSAQDNKGTSGVAGAWDLVVKGPAAHGDLTATLELEQDGSKVTGTFTAHGRTHKLAGQFDNTELRLETVDTPADHTMSLTARLKDDGTLAGYLSSSMGDMQWTGSRAKAQK
jgi:hypothetical protein